LDDSGPVLHHTVTGGEAGKARRREKGIAWPARHLSRDIGPRPPGSKEERDAARFIEREFKALGLAAESRRFRTPVTNSWSKMLVHLFPVIGVLLFPVNSHLSYALIILGFLLFLLEEYGRSPFSHLQVHRSSENILARINPLKEKDGTVVLIAHMDSPRSAFYYQPGLIYFVRSAFLVDFACQALIFMLFTVAYGGYLLNMEDDKLTLFWHLGLFLLIPPAIALVSLMFKAAAGRATPGGNDNASGVAVLLELGRNYTRRQPHNVDLWLVSSGASDAGGTGVKRLVHEFRSDLKGAYFIILDGVGKGFPVCYRREGRLIPFRANRRLTSLAKRIADYGVHYNVGMKRNSLYLSEGFQLLSRGRKAITVSSREDSLYPRNWRTSKDDYDNIDPRALRLTLDFVISMVDNIDHGDFKK
jgi:hypothetical protein